jgi:hypothetical protein
MSDSSRRLAVRTTYNRTMSVNHEKFMALRQNEYDLIDLTTPHGKNVTLKYEDVKHLFVKPNCTLVNETIVYIIPIPTKFL